MSLDTKRSYREKKEKELIEAFNNFDLTVHADGRCMVVKSEDWPDNCDLIEIGFFIDRYKGKGDTKKLAKLTEQLTNIKDRCEEALRDILL